MSVTIASVHSALLICCNYSLMMEHYSKVSSIMVLTDEKVTF